MGSTLTTIGFFLALFGAALICYAFALQWGSRWAGASNVTFRRALGLLVAMAVARTVLKIAYQVALSPTVSTGTAAQLGLLAIQLFVICAIVSRGFRLTMGRAFLACLPMLVPAIVFSSLMLFVVRPYVLEAYVIARTPWRRRLWAHM